MKSSDIGRYVGFSVLGLATGLLIWGTGFGGRTFGPAKAVQEFLPYGDKISHFVVYGAIAFAAALLIRDRAWAIGAGFAIFVLGAADEYRQLFVPGRTFDLHDVLANVAGICFGLLVSFAFTRRTELSVSTADMEIAEVDEREPIAALTGSEQDELQQACADDDAE